MLFADLLSLHLVTFLMFFILVLIYCVSTLSLQYLHHMQIITVILIRHHEAVLAF